MDTVVGLTFDILQILLTVAWWIIVAQAILSTLIAFNVINTYNDFVSSLWRGLNTLTELIKRLRHHAIKCSREMVKHNHLAIQTHVHVRKVAVIFGRVLK